ncbi:autotransporter outer membrane beta-barrel domain-containing protein [Pseudomonas sp. LS1212]|uniref:autotransporter outer membrane beta-barrel domain-containing protein n=1 Tax=Pseudomonas sp. LS1212 TaxID=2972478 RepID=UPI00215B88BF|nr:autotransporter outer membrane beta-barrel domain-containing protein [Pseudomonas sp. LS1212]UVJ42283.1 autotransporter outer membrane beta-barrel domain-containing protein [Pseudomonas sp. LS1212]
MKRTSALFGHEFAFYALSTSLLLTFPVETFAFGPAEEAPFSATSLSMPQFTLNTPNASGLTFQALGSLQDRLAQRNALENTSVTASNLSQFFPIDLKPGSAGPLERRFDETHNTMQVSPDLFIRESGANTHRAGFFVGHNSLQSGTDGIRPRSSDGKGAVKLEGESLGVYWSMNHDQGWHVDAVAMGTRFDSSGRTDNGNRIDGNGHALTLSIEGGFPIGLSENWVLEPQAQLINQQFFPGAQDTSNVIQAYDSMPTWTGRVGARLSGRYEVRGMPVEPYVRTNVWHDFSNGQNLSLDQVDKISSGRKSTTVDLGLGLVTRVSTKVSLFVSADYSGNADDNDLNGLIGNLGVRVRW